MIVTNVGGLSEIVSNGKTAYIVEPNVKQISEALEKIYQNNNLQRMSENVKAEKHLFSWENFGMQILSFKFQVLSFKLGNL